MKMFTRSFMVIFSLFVIFHNVQSLAVMSVDLGSEWMKIAIVSPGVPMEIILNTDSQRKTPLAVAFRDGERFIGDSALNVGIRFPEKTFTHFIDLLGKTSLKSIAVQKYLQRFPYHKLVEPDPPGSSSVSFVLNDNGQEMKLTPEELLSMLLLKAKYYAEVASASSSKTGQQQTITDIVLTVPPYFSQTERKAIKHAAQLAGLKVLQLINVNTAFALNYGVFRRKDFNASNPTNILFYDMGAGSTLATIASYQLIKHKERGFTETDPQVSIKGVAYDRYLGGFELQLRLRDHLLKVFAEQSKQTIGEIQKNKRAMAKLLKEAGRLKKVLSANQEHRAQIENVMNDRDLKTIVTREQFEAMSEDLLNEKRITQPLNDVFKNSGYTLAEIDSFIIIGGSTRVPRVQQLLESYWSRELSKNINADEAGALGAAYQAAHLSKGFKVKTFSIKDWNIYQINVDFKREINKDQSESGSANDKKFVSKTLFGRGNTFPQKKVITFNKNRQDFEFQVNYVEPTIPQDSDRELMRIRLENVLETFERYQQNSSVEPKGIKVHFRMDESGILHLENSEVSFEVEYEEMVTADNFDFSNIVGDTISKISSFFGSNENTASQNETLTNNETSENVPNGTNINTNDTTTQSNQPNKTFESESESKINASSLNTSAADGNITFDNNVNKTQKQQKEIKKKIVKEQLGHQIQWLDGGDLKWNKELIKESKEKLDELNKRELDKLKRDQMKNTLESFIHETRDKMNQEEYEQSVSKEEREKIDNELKAVSEWLDYESDQAMAPVFEEKLSELTTTTKDLFDRVREHRERPEALSSLNEMLSMARMFHTNVMNVSQDDQIYTDTELNTLDKLINDTEIWMNDSVKQQDALPKSSNPILTKIMIVERIALVDREVKYMINKAKIAKIKTKTKSFNAPNNNDQTNTTKSNSDNETNKETDKSSTEKTEEILKEQSSNSDSTESQEESLKIDPEKASETPQYDHTKTEL